MIAERTCPKCLRPVNEGNSPNAQECHETDDDEGVCAAYAEIATLRKQIATYEAQDEIVTRKLYEGTLHTVICNADPSKPVGEGICCCRIGKRIKTLRAALEDISTTAHCIALSGPATTPTLQDAWSRFNEISAKASRALAEVRKL